MWSTAVDLKQLVCDIVMDTVCGGKDINLLAWQLQCQQPSLVCNYWELRASVSFPTLSKHLVETFLFRQLSKDFLLSWGGGAEQPHPGSIEREEAKVPLFRVLSPAFPSFQKLSYGSVLSTFRTVLPTLLILSKTPSQTDSEDFWFHARRYLRLLIFMELL